MDQVSVKHTNVFHCRTLQNVPNFGFLVWKQTLWQPWLQLQHNSLVHQDYHLASYFLPFIVFKSKWSDCIDSDTLLENINLKM
jgi:hypothetical protein